MHSFNRILRIMRMRRVTSLSAEGLPLASSEIRGEEGRLRCAALPESIVAFILFATSPPLPLPWPRPLPQSPSISRPTETGLSARPDLDPWALARAVLSFAFKVTLPSSCLLRDEKAKVPNYVFRLRFTCNKVAWFPSARSDLTTTLYSRPYH